MQGRSGSKGKCGRGEVVCRVKMLGLQHRRRVLSRVRSFGNFCVDLDTVVGAGVLVVPLL